MSDMFKQTEYDSSIYNKIVEDYSLNKQYKIVKWKWSYEKVTSKASKELIESTDCPTLNDFNSKLWDYFSSFAREEGYLLTWGAFGLESQNPYKKEQRYYDGLVFYLVQKEYKECIEDKNISRFMSCLVHFGYYNIDFEIIGENILKTPLVQDKAFVSSFNSLNIPSYPSGYFITTAITD